MEVWRIEVRLHDFRLDAGNSIFEPCQEVNKFVVVLTFNLDGELAIDDLLAQCPVG